jgi:hypothetical protein
VRVAFVALRCRVWPLAALAVALAVNAAWIGLLAYGAARLLMLG